MSKQLGVLTISVGLLLVVAALALFDSPEVRLWLPMILIVAGVLTVFGIKRYRDA